MSFPDVATLVHRAVTEYGRLDCAFNNAGFEAMGPLVDQTEKNSDSTLDTNVKGVFFCLKHEIRAMKQTGGRCRSGAIPVLGESHVHHRGDAGGGRRHVGGLENQR